MRDDRSWIAALAIGLAVLVMPFPAAAYIGPGVGAGAVSAVLGVLGSIFLGLFAIIYYPIKRLLKKRRKNATSDHEVKDTE